MGETCKICSKEFDKSDSLHKHFREHKIAISDYYSTHYPRYDLYTKEPIKFKSKEQYFSTDFNNKNNLKYWFRNQEKEKATEYSRSLLIRRKESKGLIYSPTQVELRTLPMPSIISYNELFGNYYQLCEGLGFKNKHEFFGGDSLPDSTPDKNSIIFVDTREQEPLSFDIQTEVKTLNFGDYCFSEGNIYVERKSLADFVGTLGKGLPRFKNEIERAAENGYSLVVVIEDDINSALKFNLMPHISQNVKSTPEYIFHNVRSLIQEYPHIQFLFVNGRKEASRIIQKIFVSNFFYENIDLQLAYDLRLL